MSIPSLVTLASSTPCKVVAEKRPATGLFPDIEFSKH